MTFRDLTGHLSFLGLRLQHRALVEEAKNLKAEAIRGGERKQTKTKANGEETKPQEREECLSPAIPACTIACCRLKASISAGFVIAPAVAPWCPWTHRATPPSPKECQKDSRERQWHCIQRTSQVLSPLPGTVVGQRKLQKHWQEAVLL